MQKKTTSSSSSSSDSSPSSTPATSFKQRQNTRTTTSNDNNNPRAAAALLSSPPPSLLDVESEYISTYRKTLSGYLSMKTDDGYDRAMGIQKRHPWISELFFNCNAEQYKAFQDDLIHTSKTKHGGGTKGGGSHYQQEEEGNDDDSYKKYNDENYYYYPLKRKPYSDRKFILSVVDHFKAQNLDKYLEDRWDEDTVLSFATSGVLRSRVFLAEDRWELQICINSLLEFKLVKAVREWVISSSSTDRRSSLTDFTTCYKTRKLFWSIIHFYKAMDMEFDDTASIKEWNRTWFPRAFQRMKGPSHSLSFTNLDLLDEAVRECQKVVQTQRDPLLEKGKRLIQELRGRIAATSSNTAEPRSKRRQEIGIFLNMIKELQTCKGIQLLEQGLPAPPFNVKTPLAVLEKVERELELVDFVLADEEDCTTTIAANTTTTTSTTTTNNISSSSPPQQTSSVHPPFIFMERMIQSAAASIQSTQDCFMQNRTVQSILGYPLVNHHHNASKEEERSPLQPHCTLRLSLQVKSSLQAIRQQAAECFAEIRGHIVLQEVRCTLAEVGRIEQDILRARIELQTEQYDQHRRAVRREAKRIREVREAAIVQMLPFAAEQLKARATHEWRQRAASVERQAQALLRDAERLAERIQRARDEESALLAQHTAAERRRTFLAAAPHYLPLAMLDPEIECGICLEVLQWRSDAGIRFVTCCPEYGYTCGACITGRPHPHHDMVAEQEIVRIVRSVREALFIGQNKE